VLGFGDPNSRLPDPSSRNFYTIQWSSDNTYNHDFKIFEGNFFEKKLTVKFKYSPDPKSVEIVVEYFSFV